jgi:hypothetical protein
MRQVHGLVKTGAPAEPSPPAPKAMRVTVDGETLWSRQSDETTISPLRYEWSDDGIAIINERVEAERRETIERLRDPPPLVPLGSNIQYYINGLMSRNVR